MLTNTFRAAQDFFYKIAFTPNHGNIETKKHFAETFTDAIQGSLNKTLSLTDKIFDLGSSAASATMKESVELTANVTAESLLIGLKERIIEATSAVLSLAKDTFSLPFPLLESYSMPIPFIASDYSNIGLGLIGAQATRSVLESSAVNRPSLASAIGHTSRGAFIGTMLSYLYSQSAYLGLAMGSLSGLGAGLAIMPFESKINEALKSIQQSQTLLAIGYGAPAIAGAGCTYAYSMSTLESFPLQIGAALAGSVMGAWIFAGPAGGLIQEFIQDLPLNAWLAVTTSQGMSMILSNVAHN